MAYNWYSDQLNRVVSMEYAHALSHNGNIFFASTTTLIASDSTFGFCIATGSDTPDGQFTIDAGAKCEFKLIEMVSSGTAQVSPGTTLDSINQNRCSSNTAKITIYKDPIVNDLSPGTVLEYGSMGGTGLHIGAGGEANTGGYWNFTSDATYVLWIYNVSGSDATFSVRYNWHND